MFCGLHLLSQRQTQQILLRVPLHFFSNTIQPWGNLFIGGNLMWAMWRSTDSTKLLYKQTSPFILRYESLSPI